MQDTRDTAPMPRTFRMYGICPCAIYVAGHGDPLLYFHHHHAPPVVDTLADHPDPHDAYLVPGR